MRNVIISKTASKKLERLFDYLLAKWSVKVKNNFIKKLDKNLLLIKKHPESFPLSQKVGLRKCVITKQTTLYYRFDDKTIKIITLFDTRQHPKKLKNDLK